jgi:hypothetical protein
VLGQDVEGDVLLGDALNDRAQLVEVDAPMAVKAPVAGGLGWVGSWS